MIKVEWDNLQKTILRLDYFSPVESWEEYRTAVNLAHRLIRNVDHRVHVIHNAGTVKMPSGKTTRALEELNLTINDVPTNVELLISVNQTTLERKITKVVHQVSNRMSTLNFYIVESLESAYDLIRRFDAGEEIAAST